MTFRFCSLFHIHSNARNLLFPILKKKTILQHLKVYKILTNYAQVILFIFKGVLCFDREHSR